MKKLGGIVIIRLSKISKKEKIKKKETKIINKAYSKNDSQYIKAKMLKKKIANSSIFTNVKKIENGILYLKDNTYAKFFRVNPIDLSLTNKQEQEVFFYTLSQLYKLKVVIKAYKYDERINLNANKLYYEKLIKEAKTDIQRDVLTSNLDFIKFIESENVTYSSSYFFAIICETKEELLKNIDEFESLCFSTNPKLYVSEVDNQKELYKILTMIYYSNTTLDHLMYYDLVDLTVPVKLQEQASMLKIDGKEVQLVAIKSYPPFIEKNFLDTIVNLPNVNVSFTIKDTLDKDKIISILNSSYKSLMADYNSTKNVADINTLKYTLENYRLLIEQLANNDEKIKEVTIILAISGNKKEREETFKLIKSNANPRSIKVDIPRLRQMECWQSYDITSNSCKDYAMYLPTITLASGFAFTKCNHNDEHGYLIGEDTHYHLPVLWDIFYKDKEKRTSFNVAVVGTTGSGKSFLLKKMILNELLRGSKVFVFDVENEFKKLTQRYNGEYINLANKVLINPLQVRFLPDDEEEENSILNRHLGFLESFYSCVFEEMTEKEKVVLLDITEKLYNARGITKNTTIGQYQELGSQDYPIFSDLYIFLTDYKKKAKSKEEQDIITSLEILLKRFIIGQDTIFNGHTTISLDSDLMCFNFKSLVSAGGDNKRVSNAQILNLLTFLNNEIIGKNDVNIEGKKQPVVLVVDEFHNFINDDNPATIKYLDQMSRRFRKYNSSLIVSTQSPQDLVSSNNKLKNATAIFNNCQYQLCGMLKDNDLQAVEKIYQSNPLTETQKAFLNTAKLGEFLLNITNKKRLGVSVIATPIERYYMGDEEDDIKSEETNEKNVDD